MTLNDNLQAQILCVDDEQGILRALRRVLMDAVNKGGRFVNTAQLK